MTRIKAAASDPDPILAIHRRPNVSIFKFIYLSKIPGTHSRSTRKPPHPQCLCFLPFKFNLKTNVFTTF